MTNRKPLLPVADALAQITKAMPLMGVETIALADGLGRILAKDVQAEVSHPPHDVSAMDGYAVASADPKEDNPKLQVIGESAAGHPFDGALKPQSAVRIFTGAYLPQGADAIVIQEDTHQDGDHVTILEKPPAGKYIRKQGQDFAKGDVIAEKGTTLDARRLALIASSGHGTIPVRSKPKVAIISTGDELVSPGETPEHGQIIASNGMFLGHFLKIMGAEAMDFGQIPDDRATLDKAFDQAQKADLIVTTGGASVGKHDGVAQHMTESDGLAFWRIAMRPGKPLIFGHLGKTPLLGLPGNPVSTGVCGMVFLAAAVRALLGQDPNAETRHAKLSADLPENDQRQDYLRACLEYDDEGQAWVKAFDQQDSGMFKTFAEADALIIRPPFAPPAASGDVVTILPIPRLI